MVLIVRFLMLAVVALWIYSVFDVIRSAPQRVQNLPKLVWLALVVLLGPMGSLGWLLLGRPQMAERPEPAFIPPDDSPTFLRQVDEEIRRRRRFEQLRKTDDRDGLDDEIERLEKQFGTDEDPDDAR